MHMHAHARALEPVGLCPAHSLTAHLIHSLVRWLVKRQIPILQTKKLRPKKSALLKGKGSVDQASTYELFYLGRESSV